MSVAFSRQLHKTLAIAAAVAFVYSTVLVKLGWDWWNDENYSHGLLIPFVVGYVIWHERKRFSELLFAPAVWFGSLGISFSLLALWAGTAGAELFVQRISLVVMLASIAVYFWGLRVLRVTAVPLLLLLLSIPIPQIVFNKIAFPLQLFASRCAVGAMSYLNIPVLREGNIIELMPRGATEPKKLAVVEACSGIRSLMTLITLAVVYAYFTKPKVAQPAVCNRAGYSNKTGTVVYRTFGFWRSVMLVVSAVPIAILTNALRVSGTGVLAHYYGTRVAEGFFHSFSGWVIYIAAAVLLFAAGRGLDSLSQLWAGSSGTPVRNRMSPKGTPENSPAIYPCSPTGNQ
jgi:exosortase